MEMPEGWERLKGNANEVSSEFFDFSGKDYKIACEIEVALDLMKEMAEALEFYAGRKEFLHSQVSEEGVSEFAERMIFPEKRARKILEKFRNWK